MSEVSAIVERFFNRVGLKTATEVTVNHIRGGVPILTEIYPGHWEPVAYVHRWGPGLKASAFQAVDLDHPDVQVLDDRPLIVLARIRGRPVAWWHTSGGDLRAPWMLPTELDQCELLDPIPE